MALDSMPIPDSILAAQAFLYNHKFLQDTLLNDSVIQSYLPGQDDIPIKIDTLRQPAEFGTPVWRVRSGNTWRYMVILILMLGMAFVRLAVPGTLLRYLQGFFKPKLLRELLEDQRSEMSGFSILLSALASMSYALTLQFILWEYRIQVTDYVIGDFALYSLTIFLFLMLKYFLEAVGGRIFDAGEYSAALIYSTVYVNFTVSMLLIPGFLIVLLNDLNPGSGELVIGYLLVLALLMFIKLVRSLVQAAGTFTYPVVYLILYLCALEIAPMLFVLKILQTNLN